MNLSELFDYIEINIGGTSELKNWIKYCKRNYISRHVALQLVKEIAYENISADKLINICINLELHIRNEINNYLNLLDLVKTFPRTFPNCLGSGRDLIIDCSMISRIMNDRTIDYFLSYKTDRYYDNSIFTEGGIRALEKIINDKRKQTFFDKLFRGDLPHFWYSKAEIIDNIIKNCPTNNKCRIVTNALGLGHLDGHIFKIKFRSTYAINPKKPTIFDASFFHYFMTSHPSNIWGNVLDLNDFIPKYPEGINAAISWPNAEYVRLGYLANKTQVSKLEWEKLYKSQLDDLKVYNRNVWQEWMNL